MKNSLSTGARSPRAAHFTARSAFILLRSSFIARSAFILPRSGFIARSAFILLRSSFIARSAFILPRSGFIARSAFIILLLFLGTTGLFAQTYSSVVVTPITANYSATPPTVTFEVSWPAYTRDANHRSKIWLLVDYRRIKNNAYDGGWLRAGIDAAYTPIATVGTVSLEPGNTKGFWLQGPADALAFAATVTVPVTVNLAGYASQFGWCGVASDRPPRAVEMSEYYALYGTAPFIIQTHPTNSSSTVSRSTAAYDNCIYGLTDDTGCPGEVPAMPAITDFTASTTTICKGGSVTLTAVAGGAASYSFNNGAWSSSSTTVVSPTSTTAYTLSVRSAGGCTVTSSKTVNVTVNDPPVPQSLTPDPLTVCTGEPATLTASATGAASYSLNGSTWTASHLLTDSPASSKTYTLYIKSAAGCTASLPDAATVTVKDTPAAPLASSPQTFCSGSNPTVANLQATGTDIKWYSSSAGGASLTTSTALVSGTYYASQTTNGCESPRTAVTVTVHTTPAAPTDASSHSRCGAGTVTFSATVPGDCTIDWFDGEHGDAMPEGGTGTISYSPELTFGTTSYWARARNTETGCHSLGRLKVSATVHSVPKITGSTATTRCDAGTVTLSADGDSGTYTWTVGSEAPETTTTNSYAPPVAEGSTTYSVTVTDANGCVSAQKTGTITVHGLPTINLSSGSPTQTVNAGTAISQIKYTTTNASGAGISGQPSGVTGSWSSNAYTISGTPAAAGTYNYTVTTTNSNGCTNDQTTGTITVNEPCTNCANWTSCNSTSNYYSSDGDAYYYYNGSSRVQDGTRTGFTEISNVEYENSAFMSWQTASQYCQNKGTGWRLPTVNELYCICAMKDGTPALPGGYFTNGSYWSSTQASSTNYYRVEVGSFCSVNNKPYTYNYYVKCVK